MARYTRGKSTHQRVAKDSTSWEELKATPVKSKDSGKKKHRHNPNVKGTGDSQVVKVFGKFWVPPEDAKRLQGLVTSLKEKGLSRQEISTALQNDRRRAEKAGKRIRDKTCFNCRQYGHVLNDCPKKDSSQGDSAGGTGICFKCGSTEHTSRNCKRQADKFDFAKCFICSKTGHISRQCPENKRGVYPSGGSCHKCGELNHLAKDCSKVVLSTSNSEPITNPKFKVAQGDDVPTTSRIANPYASTEYEEDAGDMRNFSLKGHGSFKNQKIKF